MSLLLLNGLIWHIVFGIGAVIAFACVMMLLRGNDLNFKWIKIFSSIGFLGFLLSWITGGYYYSTYYGTAVKPSIVGGSYKWAHAIVMESKEHIFLLLPFLALAVLVTSIFLQAEVEHDKKLKSTLMILCFVIVSIGILISLSGYVISGSVVK